MNYVLKAFSCLAGFALSGCSNGASELAPVQDGFLTPDERGAFPLALIDAHSGVVANAFAYQLGFQQNVGLRTFAGLLPNVTVTGTAAGSAVYDAQFQGTVTEDIRILPPPVPEGDPLLAGTNRRFDGNVTLTVSADGAHITGHGDDLTVTGTLDGQNLTGTVSFAGVAGQLQGLAGTDRTVAAFYGITDETVFTGGLTGPAR